MYIYSNAIPLPSEYAIDNPIYIDMEHVPEFFDEHIISMMLDRARIPAGEPIREPYFRNVRIINGVRSEEEGNISFNVIKDITGRWSTEIYKIFDALFGAEAVKIDVTGITLDEAVEKQNRHVNDLQVTIEHYKPTLDILRAFSACGYMPGDASRIMELQALHEIASGVSDIVRELIDENVEGILQRIRPEVVKANE